jgi:chromate transporter
MSLKEFIEVLAISQMTPGAIAINSGTFVGFQIDNLFGALSATLGVITPSVILVIILVKVYTKLKDSLHFNLVLKSLQAVIVALIIAVAASIGKASIVDLKGLAIAIFVVLSMLKTKTHPIVAIILAGISGIFLY